MSAERAKQGAPSLHQFISREAASTGQLKDRPTRAELAILDRALRAADGNPWPLISIQARTGGAKARMFERMKERGWFDDSNCLTAQGRLVAAGDRS